MQRLENFEQVLTKRISKEISGERVDRNSAEDFTNIDQCLESKGLPKEEADAQPPGVVVKKKREGKARAETEEKEEGEASTPRKKSNTKEKRPKKDAGAADSRRKFSEIHRTEHISPPNPSSQVRYVSGRTDEVPPRASDHGRRFHSDIPPSGNASSPFQVRYTLGGKTVDSGDKEKEEKKRYHKSLELEGNPEYKGKRVKMEEVPDEEDVKHISNSNLAHTMDSNVEPSYASVAADSKGPGPEEETSNIEKHPATPGKQPATPGGPPDRSLSSSFENIESHDFGFSMLSPDETNEFIVPKTPNNTENTNTESGTPSKPKNIKINGEKPSADHSKDPETLELKHTELTSDDIGANIGDALYRNLAHEEQEHNKLQNIIHARQAFLPPTPIKEFTAGPTTPTSIKHHTEPTSIEHKRRATEPDIGHKGKFPRRSSTDLGISPKIESPVFTKESLAPEPTYNDGKKLAERRPEEGLSASKIFEEASTMEAQFVTRPPTIVASAGEYDQVLHQVLQQQIQLQQIDAVPRFEVLSLLRSRDTEIAELQSTVSSLKAHVQRLEAASSASSSAVGLKSEKEAFTHTKPLKARKDETGELGVFFKWGLWGGVLVGVATLGGWVGAALERGSIGRSVAEWVWKQAGRGSYTNSA